jgi:hypothetical protein
MDETLYFAINAVVFALMTLVATDCTLKGLRNCLKRPWLTMNVGLGNFLLFPAQVCVLDANSNPARIM